MQALSTASGGGCHGQTPVLRSTGHTATTAALRLGKASGKTHHPPPSAPRKPHMSSQGPASFKSPSPPPAAFLRATGKASTGRWESPRGNTHHHPPETPRAPRSALAVPFDTILVFTASCTPQLKLGWASAQDATGYLPPVPRLLTFETVSCPKSTSFPQGPWHRGYKTVEHLSSR